MCKLILYPSASTLRKVVVVVLTWYVWYMVYGNGMVCLRSYVLCILLGISHGTSTSGSSTDIYFYSGSSSSTF